MKTRKLQLLLSVEPRTTDCPTTVRLNNLPVTDKGFTWKLKLPSAFRLTQYIVYLNTINISRRSLQVNSDRLPSSPLVFPWGLNPVFLEENYATYLSFPEKILKNKKIKKKLRLKLKSSQTKSFEQTVISVLMIPLGTGNSVF